jgi:hypothetical protein
MKNALRILALAIALGAAITWLLTGANRGWTKTSVPQTTLDDVTGIEGVRYERRFMPGVDFLGGAGVGILLLAGASFLFRTKPTTP